MARTWGYTRRNRLPFKAFDAVGGTIAHGWARIRRRAAPRRSARIETVLVVEFWNIGDVVLATPFLAALREMFPGARVTLLGQRHAAEVLAHSDLVDEVITVDIPWTAARRRYNPIRYADAELRRVFMDIRSRRFDLAFESRMDPRAKIVLALTGARRRIGYEYGGCNWLLTDAVPITDFDRHRVQDWAALLEPFGGVSRQQPPRLAITASESAWAREWLASRGVGGGDRVVAVHPGASSSAKRWPVERFAGIARELAEWHATRVVAIEDPSGYGAELAHVPGVAAIQPNLRELLALLAEVDLLVGNDSGPMHMAAAVGTPTVGIFHPHAAREFAPLGTGHHVLTPPPAAVERGVPPQAETLLGVTTEAVMVAVRASLSRTEPSRCTAAY